jgi:hypothetical protein
VADVELPRRGNRNPGEARSPKPNGFGDGSARFGSGRPGTVTSPRRLLERGAIAVGERKAIATDRLLSGETGRRAWKR